MGTRGAFGVIVGEIAKIGYNQYDSYPEGKGVENLRWLREEVAAGRLEKIRKAAAECRVVSDAIKPTPEDIKKLAGVTNLGVSEQSTDDWYCLTRDTHGSIEQMLSCGYIEDHSNFPLDSLFCEWGYIVDLDANKLEVYTGFQKELPTKGRWAGRPTAEEDEEDYAAHLAWCKENNRDPWKPLISEYKACERIGLYSLFKLPTDENFVRLMNRKARSED